MGLKLRHKLALKLREGPQWKSWQILPHCSEGPGHAGGIQVNLPAWTRPNKKGQTDRKCPPTFLKKLPA
jgi:hypothetical protein